MADCPTWVNIRSAPSWAALTQPVTGLSGLLLGAEPQRRSLLVIVSGGNPVTLTPTQTTAGGITLPPGGSLGLDVSGAVYGWAPAGDSEVQLISTYGEA